MKLMLSLLITILPLSLCAHGISETDKQGMVSGGWLDYVWLGASHMVTGYDHLLFLLGVIFFLSKFKDVIKFISAFTLGHCITLIFATFLKITADHFLIDAIIALTVVYKGFDNLDGFKRCFKINAPDLLALVFVFGLIHGFGLSARLQQLPLGEDGLLLKILSFNVGVELGQIFALGLMLILLSTWRKSPSFLAFKVASNVLIMLMGIGLFVFQMSGFYSQASFDAKKEMINREDVIVIELKSGSSLEYKFFLEEGASLTYHWKTDRGELYFDFHGDPKDQGKLKSYSRDTKSLSSGNQVMPFDGSHGWFWRNKTEEDIEVTLKTSGRYRVLGFR
jgi:hypothetical protein